MDIEIRRAHPDEAAELTAVAHAAKRHWGYPKEWIEQWKPDLTISPEFINDNEMFVAVADDEIAGCCALVVTEGLAEIEHMWIQPAKMGAGVGRRLFEHARKRAEQLGATILELSADPNAQGFYERMGAVRIGEIAADMKGQVRVLPRMRIEL